MKRFDFTNPGGLELRTVDAQFIYDSLRDALLGISSWMGVSTAPVIMSGVEVTVAGTDYSYTEGWIYYGGVLYYVPAKDTTALAGGTDYIVSFAQKILDPGTQTAEDLTVANAWLLDYADIIRANAGIKLGDCLSYKQLLIKALSEEDWIEVGAGGGAPAYSTGWSGDLKFKLNRFGELEFFGHAQHASLLAGEEVITVLPASHRPSITMEVIVSAKLGGTPGALAIKILTTGEVQLSQITYGVSHSVYLNPIRLRLS